MEHESIRKKEGRVRRVKKEGGKREWGEEEETRLGKEGGKRVGRGREEDVGGCKRREGNEEQEVEKGKM